MREYIKRDDVLKILMDISSLRDCNDAMQEAVDCISRLPITDVEERKTGKWIEYPECLRYPNAYSDDHIVCSFCEECFSVLDNCTERFNYCPNCGARMVTDDV